MIFAGFESLIVSGPANTTATVESNVQLHCVTNNRSCQGLVWSRVTEGRPSIISNGLAMMNNENGRFNVSDDCTLNIHDVKYDDALAYSCQVKQQEKPAFIYVLGLYKLLLLLF